MMRSRSFVSGLPLGLATLLILVGCESAATSSTGNSSTAMGVTSTPSSHESSTTPGVTATDRKPASANLQKPGFVAYEHEGRLWVFRSEATKDIEDFLRTGEPALSITRPGAGPNGMTIRAVDAETLNAYLTARPGFVTFVREGRLWVFRSEATKHIEDFLRAGEPALSITRPGAGPNGMTIRSVDAETLNAYLTARPGFVTFVREGRLWVFRSEATKHIEDFLRAGEPALSITRPGAGPNGMTIRSVDAETLDAYLALAR